MTTTVKHYRNSFLDIENKDLLKSLKTHFFKNKKSKNLKIKSIVNILSLVGVEDFYEYLGPQIRIKEIDWHKKYLKKYLQTHKEEADFYEKFISSSFYDADLKFSVSNRDLYCLVKLLSVSFKILIKSFLVKALSRTRTGSLP